MRLGLGLALTNPRRPSGPVSGMSLTTVPASKVFQRDPGDTSGPVALAGTYTGGAPAAVQARVLLDADDSTVVDWTTLGSESIGGGAWSGTLADVPQGGPYYVEVRASDVPEVGDVGTAFEGVGIVLIGYGQSNWLRHLTVASSPPAALAGTAYYDPDTGWTSVPAANGVRHLLNRLRTLTGVPVGLVSAGQSGVDILYLMEGHESGNFAVLAARVAGSGGRAEFVVWVQGEGDANSATDPVAATYLGRLGTLHQDIADLVGRTTAQIPLVCGGLSRATEGSLIATDSDWSIMQTALAGCNATNPDQHYARNNLDADTASVDGIHWPAVAYGNNGDCSAEQCAYLLGEADAPPAWHATAATVVSATETDVALTHSMGTDFTPTEDITGFDVSDDNGSSWVSCTAVRVDATTIRLTHASKSLFTDRLVRYLYGKNPDVSGMVKDNGDLTVPLSPTRPYLVSAGTLPSATFLSNNAYTGTGSTRTLAAQSVGSPGAERLLVIAVAGNNFGITTTGVTVTPDVGSPVAATLVRHSATTGPTVAMFQAVIPSGATSVDLSVTFSSSPGGGRIALHTMQTARLDSTTATDSDTVRITSPSTAATVDIDSSAGGVVIAYAVAADSTSGACSWTGDETYAERHDATFSGLRHSCADAVNVGAHTGDQTVTATFASVQFAAVLVAASWR